MGKRANGEGTIYYDQSRSCWRGEISDESGRKRKITAKTKKDAAAKLSVVKSEIADGRLVAQRMTVNQLAETWVKKVHDAKPLRPLHARTISGLLALFRRTSGRFRFQS